MKKIIISNILVFLTLLLLVEIIFGYWFDKNNFGILMKKHRLQKDVYEVQFDNKKYKHTYKRNFYGFRGNDVDPKKQKIIFIGGSTGNQRFTPEELTIVELLNSELKDIGIEEKIYNASMDGKSTFGIINDFNFWFPKLENFSPKLFIFFIGLNDKFYRGNCQIGGKFDKNDCQISYDLKNRVIDYIKNNSVTYYLAKKVKHKYFSDKKVKIRYGFFGYGKANTLYENFKYVDYNNAKKIHYATKKTDEQIFVEEELEKRLKKISEYVDKYNAKAIYITQIQHDGIKNKPLFFANEVVKKFCKKNGYSFIPLDEIAVMTEGDFYDPWHTTLIGTKKITAYLKPFIISEIKSLFQ